MELAIETAPLDGLSDADLARRAAASPDVRREALGLLYRRHGARIHSILLRFTGDAHQTEDLLQETFLRIHRAFGRYRPGQDPGGWMVTIALNAARDERRRRRPGPMPAETVLPGARDDATRPAEERDEQRRLQALILALPEEERAVLLLSRIDRRPLREVAELLGFSIRTARNRLASALGRLARGMKGSGVTG